MVLLLRHSIAVTLAALILAGGLTGCGPKGPVWVNEHGAYTSQSIGTVFDVADTAEYLERATVDAPKLRHDALATLRTRGEDASEVADMLTRTFEPGTRGVPVYVELASVDSTSAVIVVEATGPKSGNLDSKRIWVLGKDGNVILSRSRQP